MTLPRYDIAVIGAGPAGAAAAIRAARGGARVVVFEKGSPGRDKVCGDGLTPRAVAALDDLGVSLAGAHRIDGLRMIAGRVRRELLWPAAGRFGTHGAVWPRRELDRHLVAAATDAGAEIVWDTEALPARSADGRVSGVTAAKVTSAASTSSNSATSLARRSAPQRQPTQSVQSVQSVHADLVIVATGAPSAATRMLGAKRDPSEPYGVAIRTYAATPRHAERHLEACLALRDSSGTWVPGYGWMFPAGDGTVNIGVGALSTMKGFRRLNLNNLLAAYRDLVAEDWQLGADLERPRAWRLPMAMTRRHGPGWVAVGDAAGLINPMNGEGIDYGLESGMLAAELFLKDPASAAVQYDLLVGERFDRFLRTGRRFSFLIGHPWILRNGLRLAVGNQAVANLTLQVIGNLVDGETPGLAGRVLRLADRGLALADPLLRRTRAAA